MGRKTKALFIIEGLQGKPMTEICHEHQISQSQYYRWRDQFLAHAANVFDVQQHTHKEARLEQEDTRLKKLVEELLLELKKSNERIRELKAEHPFRGYRRIKAYLYFMGHGPSTKSGFCG